MKLTLLHLALSPSVLLASAPADSLEAVNDTLLVIDPQVRTVLVIALIPAFAFCGYLLAKDILRSM